MIPDKADIIFDASVRIYTAYNKNFSPEQSVAIAYLMYQQVLRQTTGDANLIMEDILQKVIKKA